MPRGHSLAQLVLLNLVTLLVAKKFSLMATIDARLSRKFYSSLVVLVMIVVLVGELSSFIVVLVVCDGELFSSIVVLVVMFSSTFVVIVVVLVFIILAVLVVFALLIYGCILVLADRPRKILNL